jgi:hypothetical protein
MTKRCAASVFVLLALSANGQFATRAGAQAAQSARYLTPPQAIVDILDARPIPEGTLSPTRETLALAERRAMLASSCGPRPPRQAPAPTTSSSSAPAEAVLH